MDQDHPARKISNRNGLSKVIGLFSSRKMNMLISWESQLERDFCYLLEFDKSIIKFTSQPKTFVFEFNGKQNHYTPDFYIEYNDGSFEYVEIKYNNSLKNPNIVNKLKFLKKYFEFQHINYRIIFDDEVRIQPKLDNIKFLQKYSKLYFEEKFHNEFEGTLDNLCEKFDNKYIYAAMYNNFIDFDINQEINRNTKLSIRIK